MHWNADCHKPDFCGNGLGRFSFGLLVPVKQVSYVRGNILDCLSNVSASSCNIRVRIGVRSCISISCCDRFCVHFLLDQLDQENQQAVEEFHHIEGDSSHPHNSLRQFHRVEEERVAAVFVCELDLWTASAPWPSGCLAALAELLPGQASDRLRRAASQGRPQVVSSASGNSQKQEAKLKKLFSPFYLVWKNTL